MRKIEKIKLGVLDSLGENYQRLLDDQYKAALIEDYDQFLVAMKKFNDAASDEEKRNCDFSSLRWLVGLCGRLISEKRYKECTWVLKKCPSRLSDAIQFAGFHGDAEYVKFLVNDRDCLFFNGYDEEYFEYYSVSALHDRWSFAFKGAAMSGNRENVEKLFLYQENLFFPQLIYGAAFSGDFAYCDEWLQQYPNSDYALSEAIRGAIAGENIAHAYQFLKKRDEEIRFNDIWYDAYYAGKKEHAAEFLALELISSVMENQVDFDLHVKRKQNLLPNTRFPNKSITAAYNALLLQRKFSGYHLSAEQAFHIASNCGALVFLASLLNDTRKNARDAKKNVGAFFPCEIWLMVLNFIFGLNDQTSHSQLYQIGSYVAKIMKPSLFSTSQFSKKLMPKSSRSGFCIS